MLVGLEKSFLDWQKELVYKAIKKMPISSAEKKRRIESIKKRKMQWKSTGKKGFLTKAVTIPKKLKRKLRTTKKEWKKIGKSVKKIAPYVVGAGLAIIAAPLVLPALGKGAALVGTGLGKVKGLIGKGAKVIGKTGKEVVMQTAKDKLIKVALPQPEIEQVNTLEAEAGMAIEQDVNIQEIEEALRQDIFPSEVIQIAAEKHIPVKTAFLPEQIREIKREKQKKQLNDIIPLVLGGGSFIASII